MMRAKNHGAVLAASLLALGLASTAIGQQQLSRNSGGGERQPVVSADGKTVAFTAMVGGVRELFTVPTAGGTPLRRTTNADVRLGFGPFDHWPSLSISADGTKIAYWNGAGVHVYDTGTRSSRRVAGATVLAYPSITPDGGEVAFQAAVNGWFEVFLVGTRTGTPRQITAQSGPGRRLPHARTEGVLFQKRVSGFAEVHVWHRVGATINALSRNSGVGDRWAQWAQDGKHAVYETGAKEIWRAVVGKTINANRITATGVGANLLPVMTADGQVYYQALATNLEIGRVDDNGQNRTSLTRSTLAGLRRPSTDRHGRLVVYQGPAGNTVEVFVVRLCRDAAFSPYGVHGKPSVGKLASFQDWYRCRLTLGLATSLPRGRAGLFALGGRKIFPGTPLPGAPGNFLYTQGALFVGVALDTQGNAEVPVQVDMSMIGTAYYQWAVLDRTANALGAVTSEGVEIKL